MDLKHTGSVLRSRRNVQTPAKQVAPVTFKKSVSVASIFKQKPPQKDSIVSTTPQPIVHTSKPAGEHASDGEALSLKSRSSSHSPRKVAGNVSKKKSDMHPLAVVFRETSDDYRRHLYKSTTSKINNTLETLLHTLYESTLQTIHSDTNHGDASPLPLTIPAKFEREAKNLYLPISAYQVRLSSTNTDGERVPVMGTLHTRMIDYDGHLVQQRTEIEQLNRDWETTVGEIWKLGVHCLGEEAMESLLFNKKDGHDAFSSPLQATNAAPTLFVPEDISSSPPRKTRSKKRVTFKAPDIEDDIPDARNASLEFLYQPSRLHHKPVPTSPVLAESDIEYIETQIKELGKKELEEYRKAEKDYKEHWKKKNNQIVQLLTED